MIPKMLLLNPHDKQIIFYICYIKNSYKYNKVNTCYVIFCAKCKYKYTDILHCLFCKLSFQIVNNKYRHRYVCDELKSSVRLFVREGSYLNPEVNICSC